MSDLFSLFGDEEAAPVEGPKPMSDSQRQVLRGLFASLGVASARDQFALVEELTGQRIHAVSDLDERAAGALIIRLRHRSKSVAQPNTGDAWADREEDTWIDKL